MNKKVFRLIILVVALALIYSIKAFCQETDRYSCENAYERSQSDSAISFVRLTRSFKSMEDAGSYLDSIEKAAKVIMNDLFCQYGMQVSICWTFSSYNQGGLALDSIRDPYKFVDPVICCKSEAEAKSIAAKLGAKYQGVDDFEPCHNVGWETPMDLKQLADLKARLSKLGGAGNLKVFAADWFVVLGSGVSVSETKQIGDKSKKLGMATTSFRDVITEGD
jgi:hypothetical protein